MAGSTASYTQTNTLYMQSEVVRPKLQEWYESFKVASNLITSKGEVQKIGERDYRLPVELSPGGRYGTYDPNFGDLGRGSSLTGDVLKATFFPTRLNFELSQLKIDATANSEVAIKSAFKKSIAKAMPEMAIYDDFSFHTDGTAVAGTATAVSGATYTLDANFGIQRMRRGMYLTVYATGYTSIKASGVYITKIDYQNKKITLSSAVPGAATTDIFCFDGVSGTGAAPAWKSGLYYQNSYATSGYFFGIDRSTEPEVIANAVNINSNVVDAMSALRLLDLIGQRTGSVPSDIVGLANTSQRAQIYAQQYALSTWMRGAKDSPIDLLPKVEDDFPFAGINHKLDYRQDRSRIDWIVPSTWGRARLHDLKFYEDQNGNRFFTIYGGSGAPAAGTWFGLVSNEDWYCVEPRKQGVLYGCALPTGY